MALVPNSARLLVLTARKSDLEYRITMLAGQQQRLATENAEILNEKSIAVQQYVNQLSGSNQDAASAVTLASSLELGDFEVQLAEIANAQNRLDMEQKKLETNYAAVNTEQDSVQKLVDNSIKNEMAYFQN